MIEKLETEMRVIETQDNMAPEIWRVRRGRTFQKNSAGTSFTVSGLVIRSGEPLQHVTSMASKSRIPPGFGSNSNVTSL